ncbi:hypothetical protein Tco_1172569 [Tanacetum coccineum]
MPTKIELTLEQSQQGVSNDVLWMQLHNPSSAMSSFSQKKLVSFVTEIHTLSIDISLRDLKTEILLESTSNKLMVGDLQIYINDPCANWKATKVEFYGESNLVPMHSVEATSDSSVPATYAAQSLPQTGPKAFHSMPVDQLMEEFDMVTTQQAALVAQLRARLRQSLRGLMHRTLPRKKWQHCYTKVEQERADAAEYKASYHWAVKYLEGGKNNHFAGLDDFCQKVEGLLEKQEEKLRKLSIEYDEELYPHMLSTIAERREVRQFLWDGCEVSLARGKAEAVERNCNMKKSLLTVPAHPVPGYNQKAYEELVAAMEVMKLLELPHIAQLERDQDYPIDVIMAGLTLARHATKGAEAQSDNFLKPDVAQLQDLWRPHAIRIAKKKWVKGKANFMCVLVLRNHPPFTLMEVQCERATVSPKEIELPGSLRSPGRFC